ncbi:MAG: hypothetical protein AVO39_04985 [delta proteobacterium MLS_D]|jgi:hypothetical protein|nr:MAG: hypothetical protein AVO39_04985 [delta proteobacterium MLS_D]
MRGKLKDAVLWIAGSRKTVAAIVVLALYTLGGFFVVPLSIEHFVPPALEERLDSDVTLGNVRINPFSLTFEVTDFGIAEPDGAPMVGFERLFVNFQLSSLFRWALTFKEAILEAPSINIVVEEDGSLNLARLAGESGDDGTVPAEDEEQSPEESRPLRMLIHNIAVTGGKIEVTDNRQDEPAATSLHPLDIQLSGISTLPEREGDYFLTARCLDGALIEWVGRLSLHPVRSTGTLALKGLHLATPWEFFKPRLNIVSPEGELGLTTGYAVDLSLERPTAELFGSRLEVTGLNLRLDDGDESFLDLPGVVLEAGTSDLVERVISGVRFAVNGGQVDLAINDEGVLNISRIVAATGGPAHESEPANPEPAASGQVDKNTPPLTADISEVILNGTALRFTDRSRASDLSFSSEGIGLLFSANVESGPAGLQVRADDLGLNVREIALGFEEAEKPAVKIGSLMLAGGAFNLADRSISLSRLELANGGIDVIRDKKGTINLLGLLEAGAKGKNDADAAAPPTDEKPWLYFVEKIVLSEFKTAFTDETVRAGRPVVELESISAEVSRFDGTANSPFEAGLKIIQGGEIDVSGSIDPAGGAVQAKVKVRNLALAIAQPYLAAAADLTLDSGKFSTDGDFTRSAGGTMSYRGPLHVTGLRVVENSTRETLVGWKNMNTDDFHLRLEPNGLDVKAIRLTGLEGKLIISEKGKVNVVEAFRQNQDKDEEEEKAAAGGKASASKQAGAAFPIAIDTVELKESMLHFADFSLMPRFATNIHSLNGTIRNVASSPGARTSIDLEGRVNKYGSNSITGGINSFDPKEFTDIVMVFKNLNMSNFTPYSGKFAGREIDDGRLNLELEYKIKNSNLQSNNKIVIESLKLGDRVESPEAVSLPLDLAVALLKDKNGVIDIGLPITGTLDDPEFRYGALVWKALRTLLGKIVSSPFRALGALFGGGDETLDKVDFEPGSGNVPPPEEEKLAKLVEALLQRPQLKLIITGRYNEEIDGRVLRELRIRRALAGEDEEKGKETVDSGPLEFSDSATAKKVQKLFIERQGEEAFKALLEEMKPPATEEEGEEELEHDEEKERAVITERLFKELVKKAEIEPGALERLADERARSVEALMTGPESLPAERVEVRPPKGAEEPEESPSCDFGLEPLEQVDTGPDDEREPVKQGS